MKSETIIFTTSFSVCSIKLEDGDVGQTVGVALLGFAGINWIGRGRCHDNQNNKCPTKKHCLAFVSPNATKTDFFEHTFQHYLQEKAWKKNI